MTNVATLPVTTCQNRLEGLISVKDIATANMDIYDNKILATAKTCYKNIIETLEGTMIVGDENDIRKKENPYRRLQSRCVGRFYRSRRHYHTEQPL